MQEKQKISLLITDLDDTIWDWQSMWYNSFYPYLQRISEETKISKESLKKDFKKLHTKYHTPECSYAYKELDSLKRTHYKHFKEDVDGVSILHEYYRNKKNNLKFHEGVLSSLVKIKSAGTFLVGFTESNTFYTKYRIKTLGLDGVFDAIYTIEGHNLPSSVKIKYSPSYWEPKITDFYTLPKDVKKPDYSILLSIMSDFQSNISNTIYIGDKLDRDIYMANKIGLVSVYAEYGNHTNKPEYDLLRDVTHWSDEDVERERKVNIKVGAEDTKPDYRIQKFSEICEIFDFVNSSIQVDNKILDIYKNTIDVQKHFNEMEMKVRHLFLTLVMGLATAIGYLVYQSFMQIDKLLFVIPVAFLGMLVSITFLCMDRYWYHSLLQGAVRHSLELERKWKYFCKDLRLTACIKKESPLVLFNTFSLSSNDKILYFYLIFLCLYLFIFIFVWQLFNYGCLDIYRLFN